MQKQPPLERRARPAPPPRVPPQVFFLLAGRVIADRLPRHIVMVASNLVSGLAQAVAAVLLISGAAEIWHLAVVAVVRAIASSFFFPAQQGIVPQTIPVELLQPANAPAA